MNRQMGAMLAPLLLLLGAACTADNLAATQVPAGPVPQASGSLAELSAPADIPRELCEISQWSRIRWGGDYLEAPWLYNLVFDEGFFLAFRPDRGAGAEGFLAQTAYCTYYFNLPAYDNAPCIRLGEFSAYSLWDGVWLGLSDFEHNAWSWYAVDDEGRLELGSLDPYFDDSGNMFAVVAFTGHPNFELELEWVIVGGNMAPVSDPIAGPRWGPAPLQVEFSPIADHADADGHLVFFEWDFDGDGEYDSSYAAFSGEWEKSYTYDVPGEYRPVLRVTDNAGATASAALTITVTEPE